MCSYEKADTKIHPKNENLRNFRALIYKYVTGGIAGVLLTNMKVIYLET